jgi:hypothetical protein
LRSTRIKGIEEKSGNRIKISEDSDGCFNYRSFEACCFGIGQLTIRSGLPDCRFGGAKLLQYNAHHQFRRNYFSNANV